MLKRIAYGFLIALSVISFLWLDYYLPSRELGIITGTEVKRMDSKGVVNKDTIADGSTRDVYFISVNRAWQDPNEKLKVHVFRNEDTGWFPFYFKFNSADVQAFAQAMQQKERLAVITYYGWRFNFFSMFPNIVNIKEATPETSTYSIRRYLGIGTWAICVVILAIFTRRLTKRESASE